MVPEPAHWAVVVRTLDLTQEQVRDLLGVYELYQRLMRGVLEERAQINAHMAKGLQPDPRATKQLTVSPECEVMKALLRNVRKEKSTHLLMRGFLLGQSCSNTQFARAAVYSYPFFPDSTAIVTALAESLGRVPAVPPQPPQGLLQLQLKAQGQAQSQAAAAADGWQH